MVTKQKHIMRKSHPVSNYFVLFFCFSDYPNAQYVNGKPKGPMGIAGDGVQRAIFQLFFALIVQVALVTFTIGVKVPSGLIIPSMSIGAITGRILGIITEQLAFQNPDFVLFRRDCSKGNSTEKKQTLVKND